MADQVILLRDGHIEQDAPPAELYARPASVFVARFIGTPPMNILPLERTAAGMCIEGSAGPVMLLPHHENELLLGVRPEHIRIVDQGILAVVENIEYFGADTIVGARIGKAPLLIRVPGQVGLEAGNAIHLDWDESSRYFFDRKTELCCPPA